MKSEREIEELRQQARRSLDPQCQGCTHCRDWLFIIKVTTWILDGNLDFDRDLETVAKQLADSGR